MQANNETQVTGINAARLHQERGFPIDLTRLLAEEQGMSVDEHGFEIAQAEHVAMSKVIATNTHSTKGIFNMNGIGDQLVCHTYTCKYCSYFFVNNRQRGNVTMPMFIAWLEVTTSR